MTGVTIAGDTLLGDVIRQVAQGSAKRALIAFAVQWACGNTDTVSSELMATVVQQVYMNVPESYMATRETLFDDPCHYDLGAARI